MRNLVFDGQPVTVELDWSSLKNPQAYRSEIKALLKAHQGVSKGVVINAQGTIVVGLLPPKTKAVAPIAAAWLAYANKLENERRLRADEADVTDVNWIVVEPVADDQYWLCVIQNEVPLPGSDVIDDWDGIAERLNDLMEVSGFIVYSSVEKVHELVGERAPALRKGFGALTRGVASKHYTPKLLQGTTFLLMGVTTVLIAGSFLWWGVGAYSDWSTQRERAAEQQIKKQNEIKKEREAAANYDRLRHQAVAQALSEAESDLNRALDTPAPIDVLNAWSQMIGSLHLANDGWTMTHIECTLDKTNVPMCRVFLDRNPWGVNRTLTQDIPSIVIVGDGAYFDLAWPQALPNRSSERASLVTSKEFGLRELSDLELARTAGVTHKVMASVEMLKPVVLPAPPVLRKLPPGVAPPKSPTMAPIKLGVATGELTVAGREEWQPGELRALLNTPDLVLHSLTVTQGEDLSRTDWTLKAEYFVRSLDAPFVPPLPPLPNFGEPLRPGQQPAEAVSVEPHSTVVLPSTVSGVSPPVDVASSVLVPTGPSHFTPLSSVHGGVPPPDSPSGTVDRAANPLGAP